MALISSKSPSVNIKCSTITFSHWIWVFTKSLHIQCPSFAKWFPSGPWIEWKLHATSTPLMPSIGLTVSGIIYESLFLINTNTTMNSCYQRLLKPVFRTKATKSARTAIWKHNRGGGYLWHFSLQSTYTATAVEWSEQEHRYRLYIEVVIKFAFDNSLTVAYKLNNRVMSRCPNLCL